MMAALIVAWIAASVVVMAYGWRQASKADRFSDVDELAQRRKINAEILALQNLKRNKAPRGEA